MSKNFFTLVFLTFLMNLFFVGFVGAISVSPSKQTLVVDPGKKQNVFVEVTNDQNQDILFFPEVEIFSTGELGEVVFKEITKNDTWLRPITDKIILKPGEKKEFEFEVSIPEAANPGAYYYALLINSSPENNQNIAISTRVGSLLFLYVAGEVREELVNTKFETQNKINFFLPVIFDIDFKNNGTIHVIPEGYIKIKNIFNKEIALLPVNIAQKKVLAYGDLSVAVPFSDLSLKNVGPLKAELFINYGVTQGVIYDRVNFWFLPWSIVVSLGFLFLVIFFVFLFIRKRKI